MGESHTIDVVMMVVGVVVTEWLCNCHLVDGDYENGFSWLT